LVIISRRIRIEVLDRCRQRAQADEVGHLRHWSADKALDLVCGHNGDVIGIGQSPVRSRIDVLGELPLRKLGLLAVEALAAANLLRSEALLLDLLDPIGLKLLTLRDPLLLPREAAALLRRLLALDATGLLALNAASLLADLLALDAASLLADLLALDAASLLMLDAHLRRGITAAVAVTTATGVCWSEAATAAAAAAMSVATATATDEGRNSATAATATAVTAALTAAATLGRRGLAAATIVRIASAATAPTRGLRCSRARDRQGGDARG
jgi:hypothetical protein